MRKNRLFVLGIITMFIAILSLTLVSGTMARYTSTVSGSDEARVAKWAFGFTANGGAETALDLTTMEKVEFNLFDTVCEVDGITNELHVKPGTGEVIIAPGTGGKFTFKLSNNSEVTATYEVQFAAQETDGDIPLEYSLDGGTWKSDISALNIPATEFLYGAKTENIVVYWRWAIGDDRNQADTELGIAGKAKVKVTATIIFTQVD